MYVNPIKMNNYYLSKKNISFRQDTANITTSQPISLKTKDEPKFRDEFKASPKLNTAQRSYVSKFGKALKALFVPKDISDPLNLEYSIFKF